MGTGEMKNMGKKKICVVTGTRAEYGLLKPVMEAIEQNPKLKLSVIAAGMHLVEEFGYTINEIMKDGFVVDGRVEMNPNDDTGYSMSESVGRGISGMADALKRISPDIVLVLGDRIEPLAAAIAAAYMNIPLAHIHGGDSSYGGIDESARHAITKFANIHFPATKKSAGRIIKMGEYNKRVFIVGAPCMDTILHAELMPKKDVEKKLGLNLSKPLILLIQHAVTTESNKAESQITETLEAIKELEYPTVIIYPNSDAGGRIIISKIKEVEGLSFIKTYVNLPYIDYLSLLRYSSVIVGNSSSGIIESAAFRVPAVNIGIRQKSRERANNVIDVGHNRGKIVGAIKKALSKQFKQKIKKCKSPYGKGGAGKKIASILANIELNEQLLKKKITY